MRFLATMMFVMAGSFTKYVNADLTLDNLMSWLIYIGFYHLGNVYLDKYVNKRIKEVLDEKNSPKAD